MKLKFILSSIIAFSNIVHAQKVDSSFAVDGMIPYGTSGNNQQNVGIGKKCAIQSDGKIVVAIDKMDPNGPTDLFFYTYRYNADGTTDSTFGVNGASQIFAGSNSINKDLKIDASGKIVVVGESEYCINGICGAPQFVMMRLLSNGLVDSSFGTNGVVLSKDIFGTTGTYANPNRVQLASNNKYIVCGRGPGFTQFVARVNYDGVLDNTFGNNGIYLDSASQAQITDMTTDASGNIYCLFNKYSSPLDTFNYSSNYLVKLANNGQRDITFGNNGTTEFSIGNDETPSAIAIRNDGKIVVVGTVKEFHYGWGILENGYVVILNTDGTMSNLLNNGKKIVRVDSLSPTLFRCVSLTANNEMLIGGQTNTLVNGNYRGKSMLAIIKEDGSMKTSFNNTGFMVMDHGKTSNIGSLCDILDTKLLPNQQIICSGLRNPIVGNVKRSLYLMRLKNSGINVSTSVDDNLLNPNDIQVYPNPSHGVFRLSKMVESVEVFNISGKKLFEIKHCNQFNLGNYPKGNYFVKLKSNEKVAIKKLLIE